MAKIIIETEDLDREIEIIIKPVGAAYIRGVGEYDETKGTEARNEG